jgi:hypothetical protein
MFSAVKLSSAACKRALLDGWAVSVDKGKPVHGLQWFPLEVINGVSALDPHVPVGGAKDEPLRRKLSSFGPCL